MTTIDRTPYAIDDSRWIVGLPENEATSTKPALNAASIEIRKVEFEYHLNRVSKRTDYDGLRGSAESYRKIETTFIHDGFGNLARYDRADAGAPATMREVEFCYDGDPQPWCPTFSNPVQNSHSVLVAERRRFTSRETNQSVVILKTFEPDPASGRYVSTDSTFTDEPRIEFELDAFSRIQREYADPEGIAPPFLRAEWVYNDHASPPSVEERRFIDRLGLQVPVSTIAILDGFGGTWKTIEQNADGGYFGTAIYHDPAQRATYETYPTDCGASNQCSVLTTFPDVQMTPATVTRTDALGRPVTVDTPDGISVFSYSTVNGYDSVLSKNAKGDVIERRYDGDRVVEVQECEGIGASVSDPSNLSCVASTAKATRYGYQGDALTSITDPGDNVLGYAYDTLGRIRQISDPNAGTSSTFYDPHGNIAATITPKGTSAYFYDGIGRPYSVVFSGVNNVHTLRYRDTERQRWQVERQGQYLREYAYDDMGRISSKTLSPNDDDTFLLDFAYDEMGRQVTIEYPDDGTVVRYEYSGAYLKELCEVIDPGDDCTAKTFSYIDGVTYDALGRRTEIAMPIGVREFSYDPARHHLTSETFTTLSGTEREIHYESRDPLGNVLRVSGSTPTGAVDLNAVYSYDDRNRVASWTPGAGATQYFNYDELGNLTGHGVASATAQNQTFGDPARPHRITARADGAQYSYDSAGNRISDGTWNYDYDSNGRIICARTGSQSSCTPQSSGSYRYDLDGVQIESWYGHEVDDLYSEMFRSPTNSFDRIWAFGEEFARKYRKGTTRRTASLWDGVPVPRPGGGVVWGVVGFGACGALLLLRARDPRGGIDWGRVGAQPGDLAEAALASALAALLVFPPLPARAGGAETWEERHWLLNDPLGTSGAIVLDDGSIISEVVRAPFGGTHARSGVRATVSSPAADRFAGHRQAGDGGLVYMQARWMDPQTGTFLSVDPVVPAYDDPQSLNAYAYARNNPVSFNDPTGMCIAALFGGDCSTPQGPTDSPPPIHQGIEEIVVVGPRGDASSSEGSWGELSWTTLQDGKLIDAVASNFIAGQGHAIWAEFGHLSASAAPSVSQAGVPNVPIVPEPAIPPEARARLRGALIAEIASAALGRLAKELSPGKAQQAAQAGAGLMRSVAGVQMITGGARITAAGAVTAAGGFSHGNVPAVGGGILLSGAGVGLMAFGAAELQAGATMFLDTIREGGSP